MKRPQLKLPKRNKSSEPKPSAEAKPSAEPKPAAKPGARPGFFETFRAGWDVPRMTMAGPKAVASGAAARESGSGTRRQIARDGVGVQPVTRPELAKQRDRLARQFAELQWDLGGIAYEMASRNQFRNEVLTKQAAKLQEVDAQLGQVERVLRLDQEGAAGTCPSCGSLQARGAVFCWKCGKELKPAGKPSQEPKTADGKTPEVKSATETKTPADAKTGSA